MRAADNPFRSDRIEALAFRTAAPGALWRRLQELGGRAAVVGPKGSGKTTLLEALMGRATGRVVFVRLSDVERAVPWSALRGADAVCVDGVDLLGAAARWRLRLAVARTPVVLVSAHRPTWLPELLRTRVTPELVEELVAELLDPAAARALRPTTDALLAEHGPNARAVLRELYDRAGA